VRDFAHLRLSPLVAGDDIPPFWARRTAESLYLFFAHPKARDVHYPMTYGQSICQGSVTRRVTIRYDGELTVANLVFDPYQSLLMRITRGDRVEFVNIHYQPPIPVADV
jgi:hypothetical protein